RRAGFGERGPADRARQLGDVAGNSIGLTERLADALAQFDGRLVRQFVLREHAERVAPEAREENAGLAERQQTRADFLKNEVAAGVAVDIVDLFEAVEIDRPNIEAATGAERLLG